MPSTVADTPITYAADAYTPARAWQSRTHACHHSRRFRLAATSGQRLPRREPSIDMAPMRELRDTPPAKLREIEAMPGHTPRPPDRPDHPLRWDEECLRYTSQTKRNFFFGVIRGLGMVGFFCSLAVATISLIFDLFYFFSTSHVELKDEVITTLKIYSYIWGGTLGLWGGINLLYRLFPNWAAGYQPGPMWELNRASGKVIVFANPARRSTAWQVAHVLPFAEFDCYLQSTPSHQGLPQFNLSLVHYREEAHVALVGMFGATSSHVEQRAAWDMLQRYMDTSQPLPDIPVFEIYRHLDPTTLEHDRHTGRQPRFWRDMDDATYARHVSENQDKLNAFYRG